MSTRQGTHGTDRRRGATGQLGAQVVHALLNRGVPPEEVVATGRSLDRLSGFADVGVRTAVLDDEAPADGVLFAGDTLLLVSATDMGQRARQHQNVIDLATRSEVARIVYTSATRADDTTLAVAPEHHATEQAIKASGPTYTILRNGWYTEN